VGTINPGLAVGTQIATLTASATGLVSGSDMLIVTDVNVPTLTLALGSHSIDENAANPALTATLTRNTPTDAALVVALVSDHLNKLAVPASVTIPAGQASVTFPVTVVTDGAIDGDVTATITASAAGFVNGSDSADVLDDSIPTLSLSLAQSTVSEAAQSPATTGTVSIASPANGPITIALTSSDTTAATVPATVVINAGQTSASFPISAVDDGLDTGDMAATITAQVVSDTGMILTQGSASASLLLQEADGPALTVSFAEVAVFKGTTATATVTRNTDTTDPLLVNLTSSDPTKATVPATVTIPAGQASVSFNITTIDDHTPDGLQQVQISASAAGLDTGSAPLGITDVDLPDLVVSNVTAPTSAYDNTPLSVSWTVTNNGLYAASGAWTDEVYLNQVGGPQSTTPADTITFTGTLHPGQSYTQTDSTLHVPSTLGQYTVRVVTDAGQSEEELSFSNNTGTSAQPLNDQPLIQATVSTTVTTVPNGTPIPLSGVATFTSDGSPAANVPVALQIRVNGTTRTLTATTESNGNYSITFQPLQYEAGSYSVAAADPGETNPPAQASFTIVGMTATPATGNVKVVPNTPLTGQFTLTDLSSTPLTGITVTASGGPAGLTVQLTPPSQIAGNGTATLGYSLDATSSQPLTGVVTIHVTSNEGAVLTILLEVTVLPLTPSLATNPGFLDAGMLVGAQSLVSFTITNNGGAPSGDLQVSLPATPYLSLASPAVIPSLAPGASSTVTVQLSPAADLPLEQYTGMIGIGNSQTGISVPFTFTAITSAVGNVHVLVDDDFTFNEPGMVRVQGATVNLLNPYDNTQVVATGVTDASGGVTFSNVPAGPYDLQVTALGHATYENAINVVPGITNENEVFIARQFVSYSWVVQQTTIQDQYQVQLQTTFETDVPAPVVTLSGPQYLPTLQPGQSGTINVTVTNHGLIAAQGVTLTLPTGDPNNIFTALTTQIGVLPALSSVVVPITVTRPPVDPVSPCVDTLLEQDFYDCGGNKVNQGGALNFDQAQAVCDAADVIGDFLSALGGFGLGDWRAVGGGGGGGVAPSGNSFESCVENIIKKVAPDLAGTLGIASDPPVNTSPAVAGTDQAADALEPPTNVSPVAFMATALGNLGLLNGQSGNSGNSAAISAQMASTIGTFDQVETALAGLFADAASSNENGDITGDINLLQQVDGRLQAVTTAENLLFGGDANWLNSGQTAILQQWLSDFFADAQASSNGSISSDEMNQLLATTLPSTISTSEATEFINRWNLTVQYWSEGIYTASQVPAGQSTDFLDQSALKAAFDAAQTAELVSQVNGASDPLAETRADIVTVQNDLQQHGVCATVKLEIDQTAALTRSAFSGTLSITNSEASGSLTNVAMNINITDEYGNPANGEFFVTSPAYSAEFNVVNGSATLPDNMTGTISFTFIPNDSAAQGGPTIYNIGGTISFTDPSGVQVNAPVIPAAITVYPQPSLQLNYFLQRDVIGDDPFTPQVEPSEPAVLGLLVTNAGKGTANDFSITTAQPQIVENEKGLLDTFQIIGTQVGSQQVAPSLTVDMGNIAPGQTADASFLLLSSLQGIFYNFTANYTHSDSLGGLDTSLIQSVRTHRLIRAGDFNFQGSTGATDYLAEDNLNTANLPDTIYFSDGTTAPVNIATDVQSAAGPDSDSYVVTDSVTSGWDYLQLPDPGAGYVLSKVVRSDGTVIPVSDQAWTTDRTFNAAGNSTIDNELHILDLNSTGSYTVYYVPVTQTPPTSSVNALPAFSPGAFTVSWSGSDGTGPGIASYSIYVSDNGGPFTLWLSADTQTSATFVGVNGHTYGFSSVATDDAGLVQSTPPGAQASTTVQVIPQLTVNPINITYGTALADGQLSGSASATVNGQTVDVLGAFTFGGLDGAVLDAGSHTETVTFNPSDGADYNAVTTTTDVDVAQANQTISFAAPASPIPFVANETVALSASSSSGDPVTFSIDGASTGNGSISGSVLTITGAGSIVLDANQAGDGNYNTAPLVQRTVVATPAATKLVLQPDASSVEAGAPDTFTLLAEDNGGNTVTGFLGSIALTGSDASAAFIDAATGMALADGSYTFTSSDPGSHTFKITDTLAGSFLLKATDLNDDLTTSTELTVLAADPATVAVKTGSPQSATVATGFSAPLEVLVTDRYGNAVSGVTVTFQAPTRVATGAFSGVSSATVVTDANGLAVAPAFTAGAQAGGYTVTAGVAGVSASASFSLTNTAALSVASTFNTTVLQNVPSGSVKLATFNESGGSANAADYTATVAWGDGVTNSSTDPNPVVTVVVSNGQVIVYGAHTFTAAGLAYPAVTLSYGGASVSTTGQAIRIDVSADVTPVGGVRTTPYQYSPITKLTTGTLTVTNTGKTSLTGEFYLVLQGLTPGVTLQTATITVGGKTTTLTIVKTAAGDPMIVIPPSLLNSLAAGQSFKIGLVFSNPSNALIKGNTKLFSDPFDTY
jgi:CARDB/Carboxypeptidase regulatory-like domain